MDPSKLNNKKILVVEDDLTNSELITEILQDYQVIIRNVITGREAIEICKKENFDMVLMDIKLPEKNGYEATKEIKLMHPELPVIAQTAYAFTKDRKKSLDSGCSDFLIKPFKKEDLIEIIMKYI